MGLGADQEKLCIKGHSLLGVAACHHPNGMDAYLVIWAC